MLQTFVTSRLRTPIGFVQITGTEKGIYRINLEEEEGASEEASELSLCLEQLEEYFAGKRKKFDTLTLKFEATDFQQSVWDALCSVPFGTTITYKQLAEKAGHPKAVRAVGTAMKINPIPIIVPCHRVLPSNGSLGGYAYGAERKKWLLQHEGITLPV